MALNAGARLGPYEIVAVIGAGGMGEVYKAVDPRLNRNLAIQGFQRTVLRTPRTGGARRRSPESPKYLPDLRFRRRFPRHGVCGRCAGDFGGLEPETARYRCADCRGARRRTCRRDRSPDSKKLYGIRADQGPLSQAKNELFSLDLATNQSKAIAEIPRDFTPVSFDNPGLRFTLSPDGKSILYPAFRRSGSLWMMEGFDGLNWSERLREMLRW
jgi:hypothetical protein